MGNTDSHAAAELYSSKKQSGVSYAEMVDFQSATRVLAPAATRTLSPAALHNTMRVGSTAPEEYCALLTSASARPDPFRFTSTKPFLTPRLNRRTRHLHQRHGTNFR